MFFIDLVHVFTISCCVYSLSPWMPLVSEVLCSSGKNMTTQRDPGSIVLGRTICTQVYKTSIALTFNSNHAGCVAQLELLAHLLGLQLLRQQRDQQVGVLFHEFVAFRANVLRHALAHAVNHLLYFVLGEIRGLLKKFIFKLL